MTLKTNKKFMETETYKYLRDYYDIMIKVIKDGIASGELKDDIDPYFIRSVILGSVEFIVIRWLMYGCPDDKTRPIDSVDSLFKLLMSGLKKDKRMRNFNFKIKIEPEDNEGDE
jgi:hypothetical protein